MVSGWKDHTVTVLQSPHGAWWVVPVFRLRRVHDEAEDLNGFNQNRDFGTRRRVVDSQRMHYGQVHELN